MELELDGKELNWDIAFKLLRAGKVMRANTDGWSFYYRLVNDDLQFSEVYSAESVWRSSSLWPAKLKETKWRYEPSFE